jgi:hypothetical protein
MKNRLSKTLFPAVIAANLLLLGLAGNLSAQQIVVDWGLVGTTPISGVPVPTPAFHHSFNNDSGTGSTATADQGDNCTLLTQHTWSDDDAGGNAIDFNGSSTLALCGSGLDAQNQFTFAACVNADAYGQSNLGMIWAKNNGTANASIFVRLNDFSATQAFLQFGVCNTDGGTASLSNCDLYRSPTDSFDACIASGWCHTAVQVTGCSGMACTGAKIWINGTPQTVTQVFDATGTRSSDAAFTVRIGSTSTSVDTFDGDIDEVKFWTELLSDSQISTDAAACTARNP